MEHGRGWRGTVSLCMQDASVVQQVHVAGACLVQQWGLTQHIRGLCNAVLGVNRGCVVWHVVWGFSALIMCPVASGHSETGQPCFTR